MRTDLSHALTAWLRGAAALLSESDRTALYAKLAATNMTDDARAPIAELCPPAQIAAGLDQGGLLQSPVWQNPLCGVVDRFHQAFDHAPIGMSLLSLDRVILNANLALGEILGVPSDQLAGIRIADVTHPEDRDAEARDFETLTTGHPNTFRSEKRYVRADGHVVWVSRSASVVRDETGRVWYFVSLTEDITARKQATEELTYRADHDQLTGLFNRRRFTAELDDAFARTRRYGGQLGLLVIDLDDFKQINDTLGHAGGDRALTRVAHTLKARLRGTDVLARLGGDEFGAILPETEDHAAHEIAADLRAHIRDIPADGVAPALDASVGVALLSEQPDMNPPDLLARADYAMYAAKRAGRDAQRPS
jgi:diguanylate cyclase (GGDEF)-like protein/PAS domain S-box-containing protein